MDGKSKTRISFPKDLSPAEEGPWWDEHPEYWEQLDESELQDLEVVDAIGPSQMTRLPNLRLPTELVDAIFDLAVERGTTRPELIRTWLQERLKAERAVSSKKGRKLRS